MSRKRRHRKEPSQIVTRSKKPTELKAVLKAAVANHKAGRLSEAERIYRQVLKARPDHADALHLLGMIAHQCGKHERAIELIGKAIENSPGQAAFFNNLGEAQRALGRLSDAVASYQRAIAIDPNLAEAHNNLGLALRNQGKFDEAIASYRRALEIQPASAEVHNNLGVALRNQSNFDDAIASYRRALAIDPAYAMAHTNLGTVLAVRGKLDEGIAAIQRALEINPDDVPANHAHATFHKHMPGDPAIERLKRLLEPQDLPEEDRDRLLFALGKAHDDLGLYGQAFSYYRQANEAHARRTKFDPSRQRKQMAVIKSVFRERHGPATEYSGNVERVPIFVIGMSRSGKTLVESLLAQHQDVHGAGERLEWPNAIRMVLGKYSILEFGRNYMEILSEEHIREIGDIYMANISGHLPDCRLFVDTMPANSLYVGPILQAISSAKIIYCHRDPLDNCLFIYFKLYGMRNEYSYHLESLASYCADYQEMMAHWLKLYGDRICGVGYEELVRNPERTGARIYRYCGLEYDPAAIRHSFNTDEVGHWRHYAPYLGPLRQALGDPARAAGAENV